MKMIFGFREPDDGSFAQSLPGKLNHNSPKTMPDRIPDTCSFVVSCQLLGSRFKRLLDDFRCTLGIRCSIIPTHRQSRRKRELMTFSPRGEIRLASTIPLGCPTGVLAGVLDRRTTDVVLGRCHQRVPSFWLSQRIGGFCRSLATLRPAKAVTIGIAGTTGLFP